jgi:hypothetical protein
MFRRSFVILAGLLAATHAPAQHFDILAARDANNRIVTGSADFDGGVFTVGPRVFAADFNTLVTDEPGYNAASNPTGGFALPGNTPLSFDFKAMTIGAATSNLMYWDGVGAVNFAPVSVGQTLSLIKTVDGGASATVSGTAFDVAGYEIQTSSASGVIHRHLDFQLGGTATPNGIYLVAQQFRMTGLQNSDSFYIVFNSGMAEAIHDNAVDWVNINFVPVPEPAGVMIVAAFAALGMRRIARLRRKPMTNVATV